MAALVNLLVEVLPLHLAIYTLTGIPTSSRRLMVFRSYFDESGLSEQDPCLIMAGWNARADMWQDFSTAWLKVCHANPRIEYFKCSEARSLKGQFERFSSGQSEEKQLALARVIPEHELDGYVFTVPRAIFADKPAKLKSIVGARAYDWAFALAMCCVTQVQVEKGEKEKVHFIFDPRTELRGSLRIEPEWRAALPEAQRNIVGTVIPHDDDDLPPLQAADQLASEIMDQMRGLAVSPIWEILAKRKIYHSALPLEQALKMDSVIKPMRAAETLLKILRKEM